ncbi:GNAT family N-acetyltransferase [Shewanella sp.]|uniref:GNAT family N-acetyltransferase n=1 Tax=Shewanella sp. TaxID=50422 RepID=UPI003A970D66
MVAECDNEVQGFIAFDNEEIAWLYVNPKMYRKGVGKALLEKALAINNSPFSIEVLEGNSSALNFYKRCGFKEIGMDSGLMPGNGNYTVTVHLLSSAANA